MIVTKEWILGNQTPKGSWNAKQLKCLGIDWPAKKGWINRVVGNEITYDEAQKFEMLADEPAKDKINIQDQERRIIHLERQVADIIKWMAK